MLIGFGSILWDPEDDQHAEIGAEVTAVYVLSSVARSGVGTAIYSELEQRASSRGISTIGLSASLPAVPFYEENGFERVTKSNHEFSPHMETGITGTVIEMKKDL